MCHTEYRSCHAGLVYRETECLVFIWFIMKKTWVIGYGNPLRSDDGIGWALAEQLEKICSDPDLEIQTFIQLVPEMAARFKDFERIVFIDAAVKGLPGEISIVNWTEGRNYDQASTHEFDIGDLVRFSEINQSDLPELFLFTVSGSDFSVGDTLSAVVRDKAPNILKTLEKLVVG